MVNAIRQGGACRARARPGPHLVRVRGPAQLPAAPRPERARRASSRRDTTRPKRRLRHAHYERRGLFFPPFPRCTRGRKPPLALYLPYSLVLLTMGSSLPALSTRALSEVEWRRRIFSASTACGGE